MFCSLTNGFTASAPLSSTLTPTTSKPRGPYFACIFSSSGISKRHGPHHVAQTLRKTTFLPCATARSNGDPSSIVAWNGGMAAPTSVDGGVAVSSARLTAFGFFLDEYAVGVSREHASATATAISSAFFIVPRPAWSAPSAGRRSRG